MKQVFLCLLLSLSGLISGQGSICVSENFHFVPSLPTLRSGPSRLRTDVLSLLAARHRNQGFSALAGIVGSRGHGRPRFSEAQTLPDRIKGNVIDTTSNDYATFVLTDKGEIAWSRDSIKWEVIDFNEAYRGYYQPVRFVGIAAGNGSVAVVGTYEKTGAPAMFVSSRGNVWTERGLTYSQGEELFELTEAPLAVRADLERDEFVITCTDGVLFFVPPCSHCNRKEYHGD